MSEAVTTDDADLDDYVDLPPAETLSEIMTRAKGDALTPKPTLGEMIDEVDRCRWDIEDSQVRLLAGAARSTPDKNEMRRAAVLASCANFLRLIDAKKDAVRRALGGGR